MSVALCTARLDNLSFVLPAALPLTFLVNVALDCSSPPLRAGTGWVTGAGFSWLCAHSPEQM